MPWIIQTALRWIETYRTCKWTTSSPYPPCASGFGGIHRGDRSCWIFLHRLNAIVIRQAAEAGRRHYWFERLVPYNRCTYGDYHPSFLQKGWEPRRHRSRSRSGLNQEKSWFRFSILPTPSCQVDTASSSVEVHSRLSTEYSVGIVTDSRSDQLGKLVRWIRLHIFI